MSILEEDLKTIKIILLQRRGAYHISDKDKEKFQESLNRINKEAQKVIQ